MHCWKGVQTNKNILDYFCLQKNDKNTFYILQDVNETVVFFTPFFKSGVMGPYF